MATKKRSSQGATRKRHDSSARPPVVWLGVGFIGGCFFSFLIYLSTVGSEPQIPDTAQVIKPKASVQKEAERSNTRFDFFTLLPEREVIVPEEQTQEMDRTIREQEQVQYILQAGSFRRGEDADRRRAQLLLLGLDAKVEAVEANGDTWHRVYAGPFASRAQMSRARGTLISEGIETLLLRRSLDG